jgi:single-stranded-DNA-specific exonuclease
MRTWVDLPEIQISTAFQEAIGGNPLVAQTLARRGIDNIQVARGFLDPMHYVPASPGVLPGMDAALDRLGLALERREVILVWGDFDVDGQTATTLLVDGLTRLGGKVSYHIPVRESETHGISLPVLKQILEGPESPSLLLTCDTGISACPAVEWAQQRGVDVLITDHHELPAHLPPAFTIVNPKLLPTGHPLSSLPGVGVSYKLIEGLYSIIGQGGETESYLDLVALGIVADLAELSGDARYLLQLGLANLCKAPRIGVQALLERAEIDPKWLTEEHIAFELAPRLNAIGRLSDASLAVELLMTEDASKARLLALQVEGLNNERKFLTNQVFRAAIAQLETQPELLHEPVIVLSHPAWPAGVLGIVAARLVERYRKPAVLITTPSGETGRGSARSVAGINITAAIAEQAEMLVGFGGHSMAAGLSIDPSRVLEFRRALGSSIARQGIIPDASLGIDGHLPLAHFSIELALDMERLAPFGAGNPPLVLTAHRLQMVNATPVGRSDDHMLVTVKDELGNSHRIIWWQGNGWPKPEGFFDLAYTARASNFRGERVVQFEWIEWRPSEAAIELTLVADKIEIIDCRVEAHPFVKLKDLLKEYSLQVWAEGDAIQKLAGQGIIGYARQELMTGEPLLIWTTPPGPNELKQVLEYVKPPRLVLFAVDPQIDELERFTSRLSGLIKFVIQRQEGQIDLEKLAAGLAHRRTTARRGIDWLVGSGHIRILEEQEKYIRLDLNGQADTKIRESALEDLMRLLAEARAYRAYYTRMNTGSLEYQEK